MRFYPFGSASFSATANSSSQADYSVTAMHALRVISASWALSGSIGPQGNPGIVSPVSGAYTAYPPVACI